MCHKSLLVYCLPVCVAAVFHHVKGVCWKDSTEREKKQRRILGSPPSKIVLTVLFTLFQDVCSSFPELSSVSKRYICRNCFRPILNYHSLKQKIISDLHTSFQVVSCSSHYNYLIHLNCIRLLVPVHQLFL